MTGNNTSHMHKKSVMGAFYYGYFKACFFAGLFRRAIIPVLSGS